MLSTNCVLRWFYLAMPSRFGFCFVLPDDVDTQSKWNGIVGERKKITAEGVTPHRHKRNVFAWLPFSYRSLYYSQNEAEEEQQQQQSDSGTLHQTTGDLRKSNDGPWSRMHRCHRDIPNGPIVLHAIGCAASVLFLVVVVIVTVLYLRLLLSRSSTRQKTNEPKGRGNKKFRKHSD